MNEVTISVVVPTIPPRAAQAAELLMSIMRQTRRPDDIVFVCDDRADGAAVTRNRGLMSSTSEFVAFFDDDDIMWPSHLQRLEDTAVDTGADLVYPWHAVYPPSQGRNPLAVDGHNPFRRPFDDVARDQILAGANFIPIAVLVRRFALEDVGGFEDFGLDDWDPGRCEILDAWQKLLRAGYTFAHCPHVTWQAVRNGRNTAGLPWITHEGTRQAGYDQVNGDRTARSHP